MTKGLAESRKAGNFEMQFAGIGILIRLYDGTETDRLRASDTARVPEVVFTEQKKKPNAQSGSLWHQNHDDPGDLTNEKIWFKEYAPDETKCFRTIDRYGYSVKVRSYIFKKALFTGHAFAGGIKGIYPGI